MAQAFHTFKVLSFGCKVNQTEGLALAERLRRRGLEEVGRRGPADLVVVNTCCVTAEAARQGRQQARRARRRGAAVAVTGCDAHPASGDTALGGFRGLVAMEADKDRLITRLTETGRLPDEAEDPAGAGPAGEPAREPRSRAMLKVQDGCPGGCAYCIVPKVRPEVRSVPPEEAARQAEALVAEGFREIVVCGIHLGLYGADLAPRVKGHDVISTEARKGSAPEAFRARCVSSGVHPEGRAHPARESRGPPRAPAISRSRLVTVGARETTAPALADLLEHLLAIEGLGRLRLSSILPTEVDEALLRLMRAEPDRLCPHLHLSLQSGDDAVLARMGRPYTAAEFLRTVEQVRAALEEPAVTTDVLVGFPGETDEAFANTLGVCREAGFSRMHVFPFSPRPGTLAAEMPGRVPGEVKRDRRRRAAELGEALADAYRRRLVGRREAVAVERVRRDGSAEGLAARYVPVQVRGPLPEGAGRRDLVAVRLDGMAGEALRASSEPRS